MHPVPWICRVVRRLPFQRRMPSGPARMSVGSPGKWPPLIKTYRAPISRIAIAACFISATERIFIPVSASASGTFGVTSRTYGNKRCRIACIPSGANKSPPAPALNTGSNTTGQFKDDFFKKSTLALTIFVSANMPILIAAGFNSAINSFSVRFTCRTSTGKMRAGPLGRWAVRAVTTPRQRAPTIVNDRASASKPAPPVGSKPAMQRTNGSRFTLSRIFNNRN